MYGTVEIKATESMFNGKADEGDYLQRFELKYIIDVSEEEYIEFGCINVVEILICQMANNGATALFELDAESQQMLELWEAVFNPDEDYLHSELVEQYGDILFISTIELDPKKHSEAAVQTCLQDLIWRYDGKVASIIIDIPDGGGESCGIEGYYRDIIEPMVKNIGFTLVSTHRVTNSKYYLYDTALRHEPKDFTLLRGEKKLDAKMS